MVTVGRLESRRKAVIGSAEGFVALFALDDDVVDSWGAASALAKVALGVEGWHRHH